MACYQKSFPVIIAEISESIIGFFCAIIMSLSAEKIASERLGILIQAKIEGFQVGHGPLRMAR